WVAGKKRALREQRRLQRSQRSPDRAADQRAVVSAVSKDEGSARGGARAFDPIFPGALGKSLRAMAGEHSGLVHQPAGLVGASHTCVVTETRCRSRGVACKGK